MRGVSPAIRRQPHTAEQHRQGVIAYPLIDPTIIYPFRRETLQTLATWRMPSKNAGLSRCKTPNLLLSSATLL